MAEPETPTDTRSRLVAAGALVLDELPLAKVFAGATTAAVAERAGVTTGSFFHHFANAAEFADAIARSYVDVPRDMADTVESVNEALERIDLAAVTQTNFAAGWRIFMADEQIRQRFRGQMQLWAHHHKELSTPDDDLRTVGDVLRRHYDIRQVESVEVWNHMLAATGRKILPPFTVDRIATALTSLFQGLVVRREVDPERVDDDMFADVVAALAAALTVPLGSKLQLSDLTTSFDDQSRMTPQARTGARRRRETRTRITDASSSVDLFATGWESVTASDVADAAGVSAQTVLNLFPGVRAVAAATFGRHVLMLREIATAGSPTEQNDPLGRLRATLLQLARCVTEDREAARALLGERLEVVLRHGNQLLEYDVRVEVPLAESVLFALDGVDLGGHEPLSQARMLINFVLCHGLDDPTDEVATVELALRLLPDAARGLTTSAPAGLT